MHHVDHRAQCTARERRDDEHPDLAPGHSAPEQRRSDRARRVERRVAHRNADEMRDEQREPDGDGREARRGGGMLVEPRMTMRNAAVSTTSISRTASIE